MFERVNNANKTKLKRLKKNTKGCLGNQKIPKQHGTKKRKNNFPLSVKAADLFFNKNLFSKTDYAIFIECSLLKIYLY